MLYKTDLPFYKIEIINDKDNSGALKCLKHFIAAAYISSREVLIQLENKKHAEKWHFLLACRRHAN